MSDLTSSQKDQYRSGRNQLMATNNWSVPSQAALIDRLSGNDSRRTFDDHARVRVGIVTAVSATGASVQVGGSSTTLTGVRWIGAAPVANDVVVLLQQGTLIIIIGTSSQGTAATGTPHAISPALVTLSATTLPNSTVITAVTGATYTIGPFPNAAQVYVMGSLDITVGSLNVTVFAGVYVGAGLVQDFSQVVGNSVRQTVPVNAHHVLAANTTSTYTLKMQNSTGGGGTASSSSTASSMILFGWY